MSTTITTTNPVRSDRPDVVESRPARSARTSRGWALAGAAAGVCAVGTVITTSMFDVVYQGHATEDDHGIAAAVGDKVAATIAFHTITVLGALLLIVFAAGLQRRLHRVIPDSVAPAVAAAGLVGTAVVLILGTGLDTEFLGGHTSDSAAAMYNHWTATIPWVFTLVGLAGLAMYAAQRAGGVPAWLGRSGLVLGGLTVAFGVSPLEYLAALPAALFLLVAGLGFAFGDRAHRQTR